MVFEQAEAANREGLIRYRTGRYITFKQEIAYRLCHQDFFGLGTDDAADVMGIERQSLWELLNRVKIVAPQLFPILEPRMAKMYTMFLDGYTVFEIADCLNINTSAVWKVLKHLHSNRKQTGIYFRSDAGKRIGYQPSLDETVREVF